MTLGERTAATHSVAAHYSSLTSAASGRTGSLGRRSAPAPSRRIAMPQRVYLYYDGERHEYFIPDGATVADVRREVKNMYLLGGDDGKPDKRVVTLNFQGAELRDDWRFQDIGVLPGSTIRIGEREEKRPRLYIECAHSGEIVRVMDDVDFLRATVADLVTVASRCTGLPVGVFRLIAPEGREMYDCNPLDAYGVRIGDTVSLRTWDGWSDFLNLCAQGRTQQVLASLSDDDRVAKYQLKVAMHIGCHFGHIDLVTTLMRHGARADDPVGYHPWRQWCSAAAAAEDGIQSAGDAPSSPQPPPPPPSDMSSPSSGQPAPGSQSLHVESLRPPIHVAGLNGHINLLRAIVNYSICSISCKDGNGKTPFQVALMAKQKICAGYLLGKQWSRIAYGPPQLGITLPLNIYAHLKNWCERARDRNYLLNGPAKSTLKRKPYIKTEGTLVGLGVVVDGYTDSPMNGRDRAAGGRERPLPPTFLVLPEDRRKPDPKTYFKQVLHTVAARANRFGGTAGVGHGGVAASGAGTGAGGVAKMKPSLKATRNAYRADGGPEDGVDGRSELAATGTGAAAGQGRELARRTTYADFDQIWESDESGGGGAPVRCDSRTGGGAGAGGGTRLPPISGAAVRRSAATTAMAAADGKGDDCFIETGKDNSVGQTTAAKQQQQQQQKEGGKKAASADNSPQPPTKRNKVKSIDYGIPLPLIKNEETTRKFLVTSRSLEDDPAMSALAVYEKYRGLGAREYAVKCLSIANNFKEKPWLQQVRLAMELTAQEVKKQLKEKGF